MRTAASVQLATLLLAVTIALTHAQPIPLGIFYNLNRGTTAATVASTACVAATGQLDFTNTGNNCNLIWYILLF